MADETRQEHERRTEAGFDQAAEAASETEAAVEEAAEAATDDAQEAVEEAAEAVADAMDEAQQAVEEAAEKAADATPGADPDKDVDDIADRVWNKLEGRVRDLVTVPAEHVEHGGAEDAEAVVEPILDTTGDVARDVASPVSEHWWYRPRRLPFKRGRRS